MVQKTDLETTGCPLCGSSKISIIHSFSPFHVFACLDCGLRYLNPRLREEAMLRTYRDETYFTGEEGTGYESYLDQEESLRLTFRRFIRALGASGIASGRLLEVGCGYGFFLDEARHRFPERAGIELSEKAAEHARRLSDADVHSGDVRSAPSHFRDFSVIVLTNVIEHVYHPVECLLEIRERLLRGGRIVIATPDIGSFWYRLAGRRWPSFKIPEHVAFYTGETLTALLEKAGFSSVRHVPFPHAFPLGLIAKKLGITLKGRLAKRPLWLPHTMVALSARHE